MLGHYFNTLWPSDSIMIRRHRLRWIQAQLMACCLMATSHHLNQCWLSSSEVQWHSPSYENKPAKPRILNPSLTVAHWPLQHFLDFCHHHQRDVHIHLAWTVTYSFSGTTGSLKIKQHWNSREMWSLLESLINHLHSDFLKKVFVHSNNIMN